jgi:hypothetical protein
MSNPAGNSANPEAQARHGQAVNGPRIVQAGDKAHLAFPVACNGPSGPCVLQLGHQGDHVRPRRLSDQDDPLDPHMVEVLASLRQLLDERVELMNLLRCARPVIADHTAVIGASFRRHLVQQIDKVLSSRLPIGGGR